MCQNIKQYGDRFRLLDKVRGLRKVFRGGRNSDEETHKEASDEEEEFGTSNNGENMTEDTYNSEAQEEENIVEETHVIDVIDEKAAEEEVLLQDWSENTNEMTQDEEPQAIMSCLPVCIRM